MGLTDKIERTVEDFKKRNNEPEVWEILKKNLKKKGFNYKGKAKYGDSYDYSDLMIGGISSVGANRFLKVWNAINQYLNKKGCKWSRDSKGTGTVIKEDFETMKTLAELDDIEEVIKTLGDSGYELPKDKEGKTCLPENSLDIFNALAKDRMYKEYDLVFKTIKKLGYKDIKSYDTSLQTQLDYLMKVTFLKKDAVGAIYVLASNDYQIDKVGGINTWDLKNIENVIEEDEKERAEGKGGIPVYLYKKGDVELFQEYFNSLETEKKKSVLKSILEYETEQEFREHNEIRDWLEKNYEHLIREVGFEDVK